MSGICGTCCSYAAATPENEGYSDCCNDRIEYGAEAIESVRRQVAEYERVASIEPEYRTDEVVAWHARNLADLQTVLADLTR
jgi:hypothetical protein